MLAPCRRRHRRLGLLQLSLHERQVGDGPCLCCAPHPTPAPPHHTLPAAAPAAPRPHPYHAPTTSPATPPGAKRRSASALASAQHMLNSSQQVSAEAGLKQRPRHALRSAALHARTGLRAAKARRAATAARRAAGVLLQLPASFPRQRAHAASQHHRQQQAQHQVMKADEGLAPCVLAATACAAGGAPGHEAWLGGPGKRWPLSTWRARAAKPAWRRPRQAAHAQPTTHPRSLLEVSAGTRALNQARRTRRRRGPPTARRRAAAWRSTCRRRQPRSPGTAQLPAAPALPRGAARRSGLRTAGGTAAVLHA